MNSSMRKNQSKLDRLPQPLTISTKLNLKVLEDPNPYRIGEEVKENRLSTSRRHSGLAEMKQELLQIKDDMIKLFSPPSEDTSNLALPSAPDVLYQTLKQQLSQLRSSEEKLRKEIERNKGQYSRAIEDMQQKKDQKIERMRRQKQSMKATYQTTIENKDEEILGLKQEIQERQKSIESCQKELGLEKSKYKSLSAELEGLENVVRELKVGNSKQEESIIEGFEAKKMNIQLSTRIQSLTFQLQNYKSLTLKLQEQSKQSSIRYCEARNSISALQSNQISLLQRLKETEDQGQSCFDLNNQQLNAQRMEIINLQLTMNDLQQQNYVLTEHNKYVKGLLVQTEQYIKALEFQLQKYLRESKGENSQKRGE